MIANGSELLSLLYMKRPKIQPERTLLKRVTEISTGIVLLVSGFLLAINYGQLPEKVPIFFNWPTKENGMANKDVLWLIPILFSVISFVLFRLANRPWNLNYPMRITESNARPQYSIASLMLRSLSLLAAITALALIMGSVAGPDSPWFKAVGVFYSILPYLFFGLPLFFLFRIYFRSND